MRCIIDGVKDGVRRERGHVAGDGNEQYKESERMKKENMINVKKEGGGDGGKHC